jgi:hypothetical protein
MALHGAFLRSKRLQSVYLVVTGSGNALTPRSDRTRVNAVQLGSPIIGRNSFQRRRSDAIDLLTKIMKIYSGEIQ